MTTRRLVDYLMLWSVGAVTALGVIGFISMLRKITPGAVVVAIVAGVAAVVVEAVTER